MGYLSINKDNRLFWLGRYQERVLTMLSYMLSKYDQMIDGEDFDYAKYCEDLGIANHYQDASHFMECYLFNKDNPDSVRAAAEMMIGNGIVLRDTISSKTLSYLQMAVYALDLTAESKSPIVELQQVIDDLMAFRGSYDDFIENENMRNIIKCGSGVERISLSLSLSYHLKAVATEIHKLLSRLEKTKLKTDPAALKILWDAELAEPGREPIPVKKLIEADENLFLVWEMQPAGCILAWGTSDW